MVKMTIRVDEELYEELKRSAKLAGLNLSEYVRRALKGEFTKEDDYDPEIWDCLK